MNNKILDLVPYGEYSCTLDFKVPGDVIINDSVNLENFFKSIWKRATRFGVRGVRNNFFLHKEEIKIAGYANRLIFSSESNSKKHKFIYPVIISKTNGYKSFETVFDNFNNIFWSKDDYDDLFIMDKNKLIFAVLTHEDYGAIYGDKDLFEELGVKKYEKSNKELNWIIEIKDNYRM